MRKVILFIIIIYCITDSASAQTAVVSGGGSATNNNYNLSYSIGQLATQSASTTISNLNEGVLQPLVVQSIGMDEKEELEQMSVFPNPTSNGITIRRNSCEKSLIQIYNIDGLLIHETLWDSSEKTLDLTNYPKGIYILKTSHNSYKITKQ